jgi:hypothetical protein
MRWPNFNRKIGRGRIDDRIGQWCKIRRVLTAGHPGAVIHVAITEAAIWASGVAGGYDRRSRCFVGLLDRLGPVAVASAEEEFAKTSRAANGRADER